MEQELWALSTGSDAAQPAKCDWKVSESGSFYAGQRQKALTYY